MPHYEPSQSSLENVDSATLRLRPNCDGIWLEHRLQHNRWSTASQHGNRSDDTCQGFESRSGFELPLSTVPVLISSGNFEWRTTDWY